MTFTYNNKEYELMEFKEPNSKATFDIIGVFEISFNDFDGNESTKEKYEKNEAFVKFNFINYFYGADDEIENLITIAKEYIDLKENK